MPLRPGDRLGPYEIVALIGAEWQLYSVDVKSGAEKMLAPVDLAPSANAVARFSLHPLGKRFLTSIAKRPYDIWMLEGFDARRKAWWERLLGRRLHLTATQISWYYFLYKGNTMSIQSALTSKGQATIPKAVREHLGVKPGDKIRFFIQPDGSVFILPVRPVSSMRGFLKRPGQRPVTIEEMDEAIAEAAAEGNLPPGFTRRQ